MMTIDSINPLFPPNNGPTHLTRSGGPSAPAGDAQSQSSAQQQISQYVSEILALANTMAPPSGSYNPAIAAEMKKILAEFSSFVAQQISQGGAGSSELSNLALQITNWESCLSSNSFDYNSFMTDGSTLRQCYFQYLCAAAGTKLPDDPESIIQQMENLISNFDQGKDAQNNDIVIIIPGRASEGADLIKYLNMQPGESIFTAIENLMKGAGPDDFSDAIRIIENSAMGDYGNLTSWVKNNLLGPISLMMSGLQPLVDAGILPASFQDQMKSVTDQIELILSKFTDATIQGSSDNDAQCEQDMADCQTALSSMMNTLHSWDNLSSQYPAPWNYFK